MPPRPPRPLGSPDRRELVRRLAGQIVGIDADEGVIAQARLAADVRTMLLAGGACVHVHATTNLGDESIDPLPRPPLRRPPRRDRAPDLAPRSL